MRFPGYDLNKFYVYAIVTTAAVGDWSIERAIYVGVTNSPAWRWGGHLRSSGKKRGFCRAVADAFATHGADQFEMTVISSHDTRAEAEVEELRQIDVLQTSVDRGGCNLVIGSNGCRVYSKTSRKRMSDSVKLAFTRPGVREKIAASISRAWDRPGVRELRAAKMSVIQSSPESKAKLSARMKANFADPDWRRRHRLAVAASKGTTESRRNHSLKAVSTWGDPEKRRRRLLGMAKRYLVMASDAGNEERAEFWTRRIEELAA